MGRKSKPRHLSISNPITMININKRNKKSKKTLMKNRKRCIQTLFNQLRNETNSLNSTIIEVDLECSKLQEQNTNKHDESLIIIGDDDDLINNDLCPIECSTPNTRRTNEDANNSIKSNHEDVINLTKEINIDSYLTIDLTNDSLNGTGQFGNTVIDLDSSKQTATLSTDSISMSGDSDVTVINMKEKSKNNKDIKRFVNGISKMSSWEKGRLLEVITQKIFNGCKSPCSTRSWNSFKNRIEGEETEENLYIKEVILGKSPSRNSIGSNIYNPVRDKRNRTGLRMVVIDGSNVAMQHTKGRVFSVRGLKICIDYFVKRGHIVKAFVPHFRCRHGKSTDGKLLSELERQQLVVYTPSREVQGKLITSYDDRYIVQCAAEFDGVIVSGDNYRDLLQENPRWRFVIENRLLPFTWVGDMIMFPKDPLGRHGPPLEQFLRHPS
ncbi:NEDD4-binding protein 1-like isoform X1 [Danaus plexippus]|nr:NEDD4-binding protein 1-like isoform X1 [Danaus plexippus]